MADGVAASAGMICPGGVMVSALVVGAVVAASLILSSSTLFPTGPELLLPGGLLKSLYQDIYLSLHVARLVNPVLLSTPFCLCLSLWVAVLWSALGLELTSTASLSTITDLTDAACENVLSWKSTICSSVGESSL
jgi:hypothetical protein